MQIGTLFLCDDKNTALLLNIQILDLIFQYYFKYLVTVALNVL